MRLKKKKVVEEQKTHNFKEWENDFGYLNLISSRKRGLVKQFLINVYSQQKTDYITDEELTPLIDDLVLDIYNMLSKIYKDFLIEKYFGSDENLISYITEECYIDLVTDSINRNIGKIKGSMQRKQMEVINTLNRKK